MYKIIYLFLLFPLLVFSKEKTFFSPNNALNNDSVENIPPLKIEGFILGMTEENFIKLVKKKYDQNNIKIEIFKKTEPKLIIYKIHSYSMEHFIFYIYGNILGKIKIINIRPFIEPEIIITRHIRWYEKPDDVWEFKIDQYENWGLYWKRYIWKRYYRYKPQFSNITLDLLINITINLSMKNRSVEKVIYGYQLDDDFLSLHFGTRFDW